MNPPKSRRIKAVFVYEFAYRPNDWMVSSLIQSLCDKMPGLEPVCIRGLFGTYSPGGWRPQRLANLAWVYLLVAGQLLAGPCDIMLVHSTPPGIQLWAAFWARFRGIPLVFWLMDYHPEMEARQLEHRGHPGPARLLRWMDTTLMPRFAAIITLDRAMSALVRQRAPGVEVIEHPTWAISGQRSLAAVPYQLDEPSRPLRIAYSGNLGAAHDLGVLDRLLAGVVPRRRVEFFVVGASADGERRFRELLAKHQVPLEVHPRVAYQELPSLYARWRIDAGLVLLAAESAGLVSPSKFSGYIDFGLPIVYIGPADTNAAEVCNRFGAGFWVSDAGGAEQLAAVMGALLDGRSLSRAAAGAVEAARHFASLNNDSLANLLVPHLDRLAAR
jgi:colanic acid biosynthesis glycosyl transferase WcaI